MTWVKQNIKQFKMRSPIKKRVNKHVADSTKLAKKFPAKAAMTYGTNLEESLKDAYIQGVNQNKWRLESNPNMDLSKYGEQGKKAYIQKLQMGKFDDDIKADFNRVIKKRGNQLRYNESGVRGNKLTEPMRDFPNTIVTKRQIEKTRDRYFGGDERSGSPAKAHGGPHLGEGHDINKRMQFDPANRKRVDKMPQNVKDSLTAAAWEYGGPFYSPKFQVNVDPEDGVLYNRPIYSDGTMLTYPSLSKPVKRETELNKPPTPLNHCASDMMHSEAWNEMRKNNSPNTTGNKEGIAHNKKMREAIGTFKMPHQSPLSNTEQDSIQAKKAWDKMKADYLKKPNGEKEYNMEKGEFYYDVNKKKMRLIPTDDAEVKNTSGIEKWQLAPDRKSSMSPLNKEGKKDACYHKVKKAVKVWPSAYASGQLVQCRKRGASNWGVGKKK